MSRKTMLAVAVIVLTTGACGWAGLADENAQLKNRVETLEEQVQGLTRALSPEGQEAAKAAAEGKNSLWSKLDIQLYGYIKADAAWDSSRVTSGNFVLYADSGGEDDHEFNLTARQTRVGLKIKGPDVGSAQTSGLLEGDFYGAGGTENKNIFRMRHAYLQLYWPEKQLGVLAGQTWDVISPLYPNTLNFTILWDGGNIGYRHPQIRVTKDIDLGQEVSLKLAGAVSRTISDAEEITGSGRPGEDAGLPTVQARAGITFPWFGMDPTTIGLSGHYGEEEYAGDNDLESWSLNIDISQPVNLWLSFKAEAFVGENLDDYFGGIGQGVLNASTTADNTIASKGGWVAANMKPCKNWQFNAGLGIDDVDSSDLGSSGRAVNRCVFGNAIYAINQNADVGLELSHWRTDYKNDSDVDDVRIQGSFIYKF